VQPTAAASGRDWCRGAAGGASVSGAGNEDGRRGPLLAVEVARAGTTFRSEYHLRPAVEVLGAESWPV
jgi:hypothetical protein